MEIKKTYQRDLWKRKETFKTDINIRRDLRKRPIEPAKQAYENEKRLSKQT